MNGWLSQTVGADPAAVPNIATRRTARSRLRVLLVVLGIGAVLVCTDAGYRLARQRDARLAEQQHAALRSAVAEFRSMFGDGDEVDPRFVRMIGETAGFKGLKFESEPGGKRRDTQPVTNARGRIIGFLTWERATPLRDSMNRVLPLFAGFAVVFAGLAGFFLRKLKRARRELAESEARALTASTRDNLTGLANHAGMLNELSAALAVRGGEQCIIFALLELDGLDDAGEHLGLVGGDGLIAEVALRLQASMPADTVCGRVGGDDFAFILTTSPQADAAAMLRAAIEAVSRPQGGKTVVRLGAHAGFAVAPRDAEARDDVVRRAELALRVAAQKGPGTVVAFDRSLDAVSSDQQFIRRELPRAIAAKEFELHYQPIVDAQGTRVLGVEALLRWTHPSRGAIGPAVFVPVAEQMGLMDTLGAFVLRRALAETKQWPDLYVAVNLSPLQVRDRSIVDLVRSALTDSGVEPRRLILEITEGVLIDNPDEMVKRIGDLRALGVRLALDDFGSGYSNLGYLQRFPFDKLKIDKSFVTALGRSSNGGVIVQAIVALGRALGVSVLVEGVETEEQRVLLRLAGCDEMQGYLFARPASAKVIGELLAQSKGAASRAPGKALTA